VVAGGVLLYKGIRSLWNWAFGKKDKKKEEEKKGENGEKKTSWRKKALKWVGI
jgi:hypothetical protein